MLGQEKALTQTMDLFLQEWRSVAVRSGLDSKDWAKPGVLKLHALGSQAGRSPHALPYSTNSFDISLSSDSTACTRIFIFFAADAIIIVLVLNTNGWCSYDHRVSAGLPLRSDV